MVVVGAGNPTEFRTELESFNKIVGNKDGAGDFTSFTVYHRDGRVSSYGSTLSSRLHGTPQGASRDVAYAYHVDRVMDRYGNSIRFTYQNALSGTTTSNQVQELEPSTISWGGTMDADGTRSVTFTYEELPGGQTVDTARMRWVSGLGIGTGQYLKLLSINGPNGRGQIQVLKAYNFKYDTKASPTGPTIITGDRVLSSITECDGTAVTSACKKPTTIQWESGQPDYERRDLGADDAFLNPYGGGEGEPPGQAYRRIIPVDLNGDGFDDMVYRANVPRAPNSNACLGWAVRLTQMTVAPGSTTPVLGPATPLPLYADPDYKCFYGTGYGDRVPGDLLFADIDADGYMDMLSPAGKGFVSNGPPWNPQMGGYRAYLNRTSIDSTTPFTFTEPIDFYDSTVANNGTIDGCGKAPLVRSAAIAVGDLDGDGLPEIIRPAIASTPAGTPQSSSTSLIAANLTRMTALTAHSSPCQPPVPFSFYRCASPGCTKPIADVPFPNGSLTLSSFSAMDLDGDGTAELLRGAPSCMGMPCGDAGGVTTVTSPTINAVNFLPPITKVHWFLDLNGDGLPDAAWLQWTGPLTPSIIWTSLNTGKGFTTPQSNTPGIVLLSDWVGQSDGGGRVIDYNMDGRQDLVFQTVYQSDLKASVLISNGSGGFTWQTISVQTYKTPSSGSFSDFWYPVPPPYAQDWYVADLNGDGLSDIVQLETTASRCDTDAPGSNPRVLYSGSHPNAGNWGVIDLIRSAAWAGALGRAQVPGAVPGTRVRVHPQGEGAGDGDRDRGGDRAAGELHLRCGVQPRRVLLHRGSPYDLRRRPDALELPASRALADQDPDDLEHQRRRGVDPAALRLPERAHGQGRARLPRVHVA